MFFWDMWFLDLFGAGESKRIVLDQSYVSEFEKKHKEFLTLNSLSEKLKFYDDNRHLFEFPYNEFIVKDYFNMHYTFNFKPAPHFLETHIYNPWFIKRSKEYLTHMSYTATSLPFHSCERLWESFIETKDSLPLLKKFIKHEKKRLKALCEEHAPGRFAYWYEHKITDAKVLGPRYELTKDYWKEIFVQELVDYIIKLERYQENKALDLAEPIIDNRTNAKLDINLQPLPENIKDDFTPTSLEKYGKTRKPRLKPVTFLQLFHESTDNVDKFHTIMRKHSYITLEGRWNKEQFRPGQIKPIIHYLEEKGIIRILDSKDQLGEVFNNEFGFIMTPRNYSIKSKTFNLDPTLQSDLDKLTV